jgi:hypothetical protein
MCEGKGKQKRREQKQSEKKPERNFVEEKVSLT